MPRVDYILEELLQRLTLANLDYVSAVLEKDQIIDNWSFLLWLSPIDKRRQNLYNYIRKKVRTCIVIKFI